MVAIHWSAESERFLLALAPDDADEILDAVERFASTGRGFVRNMLDGHGTFGLYLERYLVLFFRDEDLALRVLRVRRR